MTWNGRRTDGRTRTDRDREREERSAVRLRHFLQPVPSKGPYLRNWKCDERTSERRPYVRVRLFARLSKLRGEGRGPWSGVYLAADGAMALSGAAQRHRPRPPHRPCLEGAARRPAAASARDELNGADADAFARRNEISEESKSDVGGQVS